MLLHQPVQAGRKGFCTRLKFVPTHHAETSVNSSSGGSLDPRELEFIARKAMSQFEAAGDIIGRLYALIGLSHSQKAGRPLEEDKDMPGCALVLERAKAEALSVMRLVDKLMPWTWGRPANKARQEIQAVSSSLSLDGVCAVV